MQASPIEPMEFCCRPFELLQQQWLLLTAGENTPGGYNTMTVAWGGFGILWNKPVAQIFVRPTRFTYGFLERFPSFTLCAFPDADHKKLSYCGAHSGKDVDKIKQTGLTPVASQTIGAPGFAEAELILECRKIYAFDIDPAHTIDNPISEHYPQKDYHRCYFAQILAISGDRTRYAR